MSGPTASTVTSAPGAGVQPFVQFGLQEAQRLYQQNPIQAYQGPMYVEPSQATQTALQAAAGRAMTGSPLQQAALQQQLGTVSGQYLGMNPFFQGAFQAAAAPVTRTFQDEMARITSEASRAGRYGSGAMQQLQERSAGKLAEALSNIGGTLGFRGYEAERARQEEAARAAPALAQTEYQDIQRLLSTGQAQEAYQQARIAADMARFQQQQMAPYASLQSFLSGVYGAPAGQTVQTEYAQNPLMQAVGAGIAGGTLFGENGQLNIPAGVGSALLAYLLGR